MTLPLSYSRAGVLKVILARVPRKRKARPAFAATAEGTAQTNQPSAEQHESGRLGSGEQVQEHDPCEAASAVVGPQVDGVPEGNHGSSGDAGGNKERERIEVTVNRAALQDPILGAASSRMIERGRARAELPEHNRRRARAAAGMRNRRAGQSNGRDRSGERAHVGNARDYDLILALNAPTFTPAIRSTEIGGSVARFAAGARRTQLNSSGIGRRIHDEDLTCGRCDRGVRG